MITIFKTTLLLLIISQGLFSSSVHLTKEEKEWIIKNPKIKVAMPINYKPFSFKIDGQPKGLDFDLLDLIEKKTGLKFEKIQNSWGESVHNFKTQKVDMITSFAYKKNREKFSLFTTSYYTSNLVLKVYGKQGLILDRDKSWAENFINKKIGVIKNISFTTYLENKGIVSIDEFDSKLDLLEAMSNDKIDFLILLKDLHSSTQKKFKNIVKYNEIELTDLRKSKNLIGVVKSKKTLHSIIQKVLNSISKKEINHLHKKWTDLLSKKKEIRFTKKERTYLQNKKLFTFCITPSWIPFGQITKDGKNIGISADILKIVTNKIQKEFRLVPTENWSQSLQYIKEKKCDIIPLIMETPTRKSYMNFTKPYISEPIVVTTKLDEIYIRDETQLLNKKLAMVQNSAFIEILQLKNPELELVSVKNIKEGLQKVRLGEVFAYIGTIPDIGYAIQKYGFVDLKIAGELDYKIQLSIASRDDEPVLNSIMQKVINSIPKEEVRKIIGHWIKIKVQQEVNYEKIFYLIGFFAIIIITILYQNRLIRKKVQEAVRKNQEQERLIFFQSKLATMGETINIIAHQWRQPISVISNYLTNIQLNIEYKDKYDKKEILNSISNAQEGLKYISSTISLFQSYLKPREIASTETFEINDTINRSIKLFEAILDKYQIKVQKDIPEYIKIKGNQEYFIQVLMVLLTNSKDAFIENNTLNPFIQFTVNEFEDMIIFSFEDNAKGIQVDENIFDPYISGKKSTGLGLFIAKNIIKKIFNGDISVKNTQNGAKFFIYFPIEK